MSGYWNHVASDLVAAAMGTSRRKKTRTALLSILDSLRTDAGSGKSGSPPRAVPHSHCIAFRSGHRLPLILLSVLVLPSIATYALDCVLAVHTTVIGDGDPILSAETRHLFHEHLNQTGVTKRMFFQVQTDLTTLDSFAAVHRIREVPTWFKLTKIARIWKHFDARESSFTKAQGRGREGMEVIILKLRWTRKEKAKYVYSSALRKIDEKKRIQTLQINVLLVAPKGLGLGAHDKGTAGHTLHASAEPPAGVPDPYRPRNKSGSVKASQRGKLRKEGGTYRGGLPDRPTEAADPDQMAWYGANTLHAPAEPPFVFRARDVPRNRPGTPSRRWERVRFLPAALSDCKEESHSGLVGLAWSILGHLTRREQRASRFRPRRPASNRSRAPLTIWEISQGGGEREDAPGGEPGWREGGRAGKKVEERERGERAEDGDVMEVGHSFIDFAGGSVA
ncbi:hypothetical protein DFH09DRAFT_1271044 [Mycena vulgaris]|nr:hypothetical protein DFH09DRAFT_1271044 [Mycena vulgaris]